MKRRPFKHFARNDFAITQCCTGANSEKLMSARSQTQRRETLNIRIKADDRGLIDRAAQLRGQNCTDFILEAARRAAEEALLDRTLITVSSEAYREFVKRLDGKPRPGARLRRTLRATAPWRRRSCWPMAPKQSASVSGVQFFHVIDNVDCRAYVRHSTFSGCAPCQPSPFVSTRNWMPG